MLHRTLTSPSWRLISITLTLSVFIYYRWVIIPSSSSSSSSHTEQAASAAVPRLHSPSSSDHHHSETSSGFLHELFKYYEYLILHNKLGVLVHLHTVFLLLYYACRFVLHRFLGNITQKEKDAFSNGLIPYVTINTLFVFYILNHFTNINYLNEIIIWIVWLSIVGILKTFNLICRVRTNTMMEDVMNNQREKHLNLIILLSIIFFVDLAMILFATVYVIGFYNNDLSYYFLFIYENVTLLLENARLFAKYGGFVCEIFDLIHDSNTNSNSNKNQSSSLTRSLLSMIFNTETIYITQFVLEILLLLIAIVHYMHVWYNNGLQFAVIDVLLFALINNSFNEFRIQAKRLLEYKKIQVLLKDHFPIPTLESSSDSSSSSGGGIPGGIDHQELCSICHENFHREELKNCRKLECGHIFHLACIMQWMRSGSFTCPICRRQLLPPAAEATAEAATTTSGDSSSTRVRSSSSSLSSGGSELAHGELTSGGNSGDVVHTSTTTLLSTSGGSWLPFSLQIQKETTSDIDTSDSDDEDEGVVENVGQEQQEQQGVVDNN